MILTKAHKILNRQQSGDTIVEVVIAIAIISLVLVGAYVVTNRSLQAVRDSEEHSEALQLLQGQAELLRSAASQAGFFTSGYSFSRPFCLTTSLPYPSSSTQYCMNQNNLYNLAIVLAPGQTAPTPPDTTTSLFDLTATWPALAGGIDTVQLAYEVEIL